MEHVFKVESKYMQYACAINQISCLIIWKRVLWIDVYYTMRLYSLPMFDNILISRFPFGLTSAIFPF